LRTTNSGSEKNNWKKTEKVDTLSYKTVSANKATVQKEWVLIDAKDQILGRLTSVAAKILRGKHKRNFTPHVDCGDYVIIINAAHIKLTGNKFTDKQYISYTGYPGGQKIKTPAMLLAKRPAELIEISIKGMLPKNRLGREMFRNLHVYAGPDHLHEAQQPKHIDLTSIK
jgi:large subunit ribosomal protein L13